jgi:hypothetical protein
MINIIVEYIEHIPLDAYSKGQKSLHQNSKKEVFKVFMNSEHS